MVRICGNGNFWYIDDGVEMVNNKNMYLSQPYISAGYNSAFESHISKSTYYLDGEL